MPEGDQEPTQVDDDPEQVTEVSPPPDPRITLAEWANQQDEWLRSIVRVVLSTGRPLPPGEVENVYSLFRQEEALDKRELPVEPKLELEAGSDEAELPLAITKISNVSGVNALISGAVIEPHAGLTILYGENGTGKTGYSRIFKALAGSRTADDIILGDISADTEEPQSAEIGYSLGPDAKIFTWSGERGQAPFTRMSIFDSLSVNFHVDDELEYVYVPTVLALFNHVISGVKAVQTRIDSTVNQLTGAGSMLLGRFPGESSIYPFIETLGATTDLEDLRAKADTDTKVEKRIEALRLSVAALDANTIGSLIKLRQRDEQVLKEAVAVATGISSFDASAYTTALGKRAELARDYEAFRTELFKAADLPADPEATWEAFVASGEEYRQHLDAIAVHDADRCLYCRQPLGDLAQSLVRKYGEYLADKINGDITIVNTLIRDLTAGVRSLTDNEVASVLKEYEGWEDKPAFHSSLESVGRLMAQVKQAVSDDLAIDDELLSEAPTLNTVLEKALVATVTELTELREQDANRASALAEKRNEVTELVAAAELAKSWTQIEAQVTNAKEADRLRILGKVIPGVSRSVTELSKTASDQLINQNFEQLFIEECDALRARPMKLEFVGREGKAQRRKVLKGKHKPSKVLSEGEQNVLAMADFLAEARLAGITAPVIFDDPVSSLDHRRINEVAKRVALLAEDNQVIVFTHDILFATTLLSLFETSKRCTYFQITDDDGVGKVTRASGPRWDTLASLSKHISETIQAANAVDGEARAALVREGYDWIRSWCEVFTETELLQGVSQRYQPNIRMTALPNIKLGALPDAIATVTRVFEEACRYIAGHSQPLATLGVAPTLSGLESNWQELQVSRKLYLAADT